MKQVQAAAESGSVQVVQKVARILDCFSVETPWLSASEIRRATSLPTTTVSRLLSTCVEENLLQRRGDEYTIGLHVTAWAAAASAGSDLIAIARPLVVELRDRSKESCGIYVRQGGTRVSVLQVESTQSIIYRGYLGQVMPLHAGAAGKVFMAHDRQALRIALEEGLVSYTPNTVIDRAALEEQLEQVRAQGWAFSDEERVRGLSSLSAPIFGPDGHVIAAVAIGGPAFRLDREAAKDLAVAITECANSISRGMLWRGTTPIQDHQSQLSINSHE